MDRPIEKLEVVQILKQTFLEFTKSGRDFVQPGPKLVGCCHTLQIHIVISLALLGLVDGFKLIFLKISFVSGRLMLGRTSGRRPIRP